MKRKKIVALLLSITMIAAVTAGCGGQDNAAADTAESATGSKSEENEISEDADTPDDTGTASDISLPLTEDAVTLTIFMPTDSNFTSGDWNNSGFFQEMERRTGVHLEFQTPATGEERTAFNLMIASGELPDIICYSYLYPEGIDAAIDDGYYLDLTPYLDTYLTNYNAARNTSESILRDTMTDSSRIGQMYMVLTEEQGPWAGLQIRQDWLDELELDVPVTYDDWEKVLTAFKEEKGAYAPMALSSYGYFIVGNELSAGFNASAGFMNQNGTVVYSPITNEWRQYLQTMHDWYQKGLINPDFMTASPYFVDMELVTSGTSGAWFSMYTMPSLYEQSAEGMNVAPVAVPVQNEGDDAHLRVVNQTVKACIAIAADCEYPEIAMQYLDYLFTEEGSLLANYGTENESFVYDEEGNPVFTDKILNNPEGLGYMQALVNDALPPEKLPSFYDWTRELATIPAKDQLSYDVWSSTGEDWVMPASLALTAEESRESAKIYADIETYFNECTAKFIIGTLDVNGDDWDTYVKNIQGMNIERCVEIRQDALNRYLAR